MRNLFFVRHGEDEDSALGIINGRRDIGLTGQGKVQAAAAADQLQKQGIVAIYTSPLRRAKQTAEIVARKLGLAAVGLESELIERDYGVLAGCPCSDIQTIAERVLVVEGFQHVLEAQGVESYLELWKRAGRVLQRIQDLRDDGPVLIVAHNEIGRMIRANFDNIGWEDELLRPPLSYCEVLVFRVRE